MGPAIQKWKKSTHLSITAHSFDKVNLSVEQDGNMAANTKVKSEDVDDKTFTTPASVYTKASW